MCNDRFIGSLQWVYTCKELWPNKGGGNNGVRKEEKMWLTNGNSFPNLEEPLKKANFWSHISCSESDFGVFFLRHIGVERIKKKKKLTYKIVTSRGQDGFNIYMKKYLRDVQMYLHRFCNRLQKWLQFITPPCILAFDSLTVKLLPSRLRGYVLPLEPEFAVCLALATRVQEQWGCEFWAYGSRNLAHCHSLTLFELCYYLWNKPSQA